ncbi:VPLPA-CTERM sorting domain-containing protein [Litoreibacter roseus]|uniref:VPLPA-CTERM protein sorting domain-containing protein n=1 Tax=Litoreibacter roseus TaxID=2601869 RepID=A0A6N6JJD7_9RHOB|nr:VPLPA-CTERM sorting domain-containing protein [Litoreibacter roseus]GFE66396.1 hypothetical protein KIN_34700 [Litoreibacter roseus]
MKILIPFFLFTVAAAPAAAATFTYDVVVTVSDDLSPPPFDDVPEFDLPDVGTTGTVTVALDSTIFDGSPLIPEETQDISSILSVSATIGDLTTDLSEPAILPFLFDSGFRLANGAFSAIDIFTSTPSESAALAGGFSFTAPDGVATPTTLSDVLAILGDEGTGLVFSFNGDINEEFVQFAAEIAPSVPAIPLPAGSALLLTGLAAFGVARGKQKA